jgi:hypothetical protein
MKREEQKTEEKQRERYNEIQRKKWIKYKGCDLQIN